MSMSLSVCQQLLILLYWSYHHLSFTLVQDSQLCFRLAKILLTVSSQSFCVKLYNHLSPSHTYLCSVSQCFVLVFCSFLVIGCARKIEPAFVGFRTGDKNSYKFIFFHHCIFSTNTITNIVNPTSNVRSIKQGLFTECVNAVMACCRRRWKCIILCCGCLLSSIMRSFGPVIGVNDRIGKYIQGGPIKNAPLNVH